MRLSKAGVVTKNYGICYPALHDPCGYALWQYRVDGKLYRLDPDGTGMPTYRPATADEELQVLKQFEAGELDVLAIRWTSEFGYCAVEALSDEQENG
jgi:hypothetical protein